MRVTLTTAILGVGAVGDTVEDPRGEDWIARGLAVAGEATVAKLVAAAPAAAVEPAADVPSRVPDFFAPEPPAVEEPKRRKKH